MQLPFSIICLIVIVKMCDFLVKDTHKKSHPNIKLQRLQEIWI